jgi:hypothetical protein
MVCKIHRLLHSERQKPERTQAAMQKLMNAILERAVEIDQHVTAENDLEFIEGAIGHQVVWGKHDVLTQCRLKEYTVVPSRVILGERASAAGRNIIARVFLY